jgi:hypothetical protein
MAVGIGERRGGAPSRPPLTNAAFREAAFVDEVSVSSRSGAFVVETASCGSRPKPRRR